MTRIGINDRLGPARELGREILRIAAEQQTDLIVVGVKGRGAVDLVFFGSTTNEVVREAACAVLTGQRPDPAQ